MPLRTMSIGFFAGYLIVFTIFEYRLIFSNNNDLGGQEILRNEIAKGNRLVKLNTARMGPSA